MLRLNREDKGGELVRECLEEIKSKARRKTGKQRRGTYIKEKDGYRGRRDGRR